MSDPTASTDALLAALPSLEASIAALKTRPWEETIDSLEGLDRAKMNVLLAYAINDILWVYLKTVGIDPNTHAVSAELDRIKTYYTKIQNIENPPQRTQRVDKAAAHRFITAALPRPARTNQIGSIPSTSAQAQAAADARIALGQAGDPRPEVEVGAEGDTSKAGRFRFVPRQAVKARARAEDAWSGIGEMDDESDEEDEGIPEGEGQATGEKTLFDEDGEVVPGESEDVPGETEDGRDEMASDGEADLDGDEDVSMNGAEGAAPEPGTIYSPGSGSKAAQAVVGEKKKKAKASDEVSQRKRKAKKEKKRAKK